MQNTQMKTINKNDLFAGLEIKKNADIIKSLRKGDGCKSSHFDHNSVIYKTLQQLFQWTKNGLEISCSICLIMLVCLKFKWQIPYY